MTNQPPPELLTTNSSGLLGRSDNQVKRSDIEHWQCAISELCSFLELASLRIAGMHRKKPCKIRTLAAISCLQVNAHRDVAIRMPNLAAKLLLEVGCVDRRIFLELFRQIFDREDRATLACRDAGAATDALFRIDKKLFDLFISGLGRFGMDGLPQTDGDAQIVFDALVGDYAIARHG